MKNFKIAVSFILMMSLLIFAQNIFAPLSSSLRGCGSPTSYGIVYEDISYGQEDCQKYDLHIPAGLSKGQSQGVMLFIHGGSWIRGDKSSMTKFCEEYAEEGYITATTNYTLLKEGDKNTTIWDSLNDISACISSIKKDLANLGYEADKLAISGNSAGGHITLLYGFSKADEAEIPITFIFPRTGPSDMNPYAWEPVKPKKVAKFLSMFTGTEINEDMYLDGSCKNLLDEVAPITYIDENTVPVLLAYSGNDTIVGMNHYQVMKPYLDNYEVPYDYVLFPNSDHYLKEDPESYEEFKDKVLLWAEKYL